MRGRAWLMAFRLALPWPVTGCEEQTATEVIVNVSAAPALAAAARTLRVRVENDEGVAVLERDKELTPSAARLARVPLVPRNDDPTRRFRFEATLLTEAGAPLAKIAAEGGYRDGELRELNLVFDAECAGKLDCGEGRTCERGRCAGSCFEPGPAGHTEADRPTCGECERCAGRCEAANGARCGCPGETCSGGSCEPRDRVLFADAGEFHTCALLDDGSTWCWGSSSFSGNAGTAGEMGRGRLGTGPLGADSPSPVRVPGATCRRALAVSGDHTCCVEPDARFCWGRNDVGQLGGDVGDIARTPRRFDDPFVLESLASGWRHTCGITGDGRVFCWGYDERGNVGNGEMTSAVTEPVEVGQRYAQVAAGGDHTCGVTTGGQLLCWGYNASNELGVPGPDQALPARSGCTPENAGKACFNDWIATGSGAFHSCGIRSSGELYCWGGNQNGQLGIGPPTTSFQESEPQRVASSELWADVAGGRSFTCALTRLGKLYCWGLNEDRQLGLPDVDFVNAPARVDVPEAGGFRQLGLGEYHACAVRADRTLWCWGRNDVGQVGTGKATPEPVDRPVRVCF